MITQEVTAGQIEITENGSVQIRLHLKLFNDGAQIGTTQFHRTMINPGDDPELTKLAVDLHLGKMRWPSIPADEWKRVISHMKLAHTPKAVAAFAKQADEITAKISA